MVKNAGTMANIRVIKRLSHGAIRRLRCPSIIICPARVPVTVELCPAAISAMANKAGRQLTENIGKQFMRILYLGNLMVTPAKKAVAASINIAAFTKKARLSAMVVSQKL
jgi:hypothetical protein